MTKRTLRTKSVRRKHAAKSRALPREARAKKRIVSNDVQPKKALANDAPRTLAEAEKLVAELKQEEGRRRGEDVYRVMQERAAAGRVNLKLTGLGLTPGDHVMAALTGHDEHTDHHIDFAATMAALTVANELDVVVEALDSYRDKKARESKSVFSQDQPLGAIGCTIRSIATRLRAASHLINDIHEANKAEGGAS